MAIHKFDGEFVAECLEEKKDGHEV